MGRPRALVVLLSMSCLPMLVAAAQVEAPSRWRTGAQKPRADRPVTVQPTEPAAAAAITWFGIGGPVTGGQSSFGLVELNRPAPAGGLRVELSSSHPAVKVPATISIDSGAADVGFPVETTPVAGPTTATISARIGAAVPQTATVTILTPSLSLISCTPQTVPSGSSTTCKVQLDGPVASPSLGTERDERFRERGKLSGREESRAITVELTSSNTAVLSVQPTVDIGPGERSASFEVETRALAQSASALISASLGEVYKGTNVHVLAVAIASLECGASSLQPQCSHTPRYGGSGHPYVRGRIGLTAPAPAGGLNVKLSASPDLASFRSGSEHNSVNVREGSTEQTFDIYLRPVAKETRVTVSARDPLTGGSRTMLITIVPPAVTYLAFVGYGNPAVVEGVPVGGQKIRMRAVLTGTAPSGGWPVELRYSGTTDVTGPSRVVIPSSKDRLDFDVTVGPCSVSDTCEVVVSTAGEADTLFVKP